MGTNQDGLPSIGLDFSLCRSVHAAELRGTQTKLAGALDEHARGITEHGAVGVRARSKLGETCLPLFVFCGHVQNVALLPEDVCSGGYTNAQRAGGNSIALAGSQPDGSSASRGATLPM